VGFGTGQWKPNPLRLSEKRRRRCHMARGIVTGVLYLHRRAKRCPPIDNYRKSYHVDTLMDKYSAACPRSPDAPTAAKRKWLAQFAIPWCQWVVTHKKCPVRVTIPRPHAIEGEPFCNDSMTQSTSTDTTAICHPHPTTRGPSTRRGSGPLNFVGMFINEPESGLRGTK
jgi:hypothetical protein